MTEPSIHLTADTLDMYFGAGKTVTISLAADPDCRLRINPSAQELELWVRGELPEPDVTILNRVSVDTEEMDDSPWTVLSVDARDAHFEAYSLLAAVVDELVSGRPFDVATARSLDTFRDLLARRGRLSEQNALGLLGELLVLDRLFDAMGPAAALATWLGPDSEEHDFVLADLDAEVKTTLSERRRHLIASETQLLASPGRPLWLVSLQLTRAGSAIGAFGLPGTIDRIRAQLPTGAHLVDTHLANRGWRDGDVDLYRERYMWRSTPAAFIVDGRFPAVTRPRLDSVIPRPDLVGPVSYRIDVTSLEPGIPTGPLAGFVVKE